MKIRIVDIAKKAEVSAGTVDRYIHQRGKVSKKAAEKIQKAVKELGYEPDIMARNLALKKELKIICLLPDPKETKYWERPDAGIDKAIKELSSFKVLIEKIYFAPRVNAFNEACDHAIESKADGIIYVPIFFEESTLFAEKLIKLEIPFIHINIHHSEASPLSFIGQNAYDAGKVAASLCRMALRNNQEILITYISKEQQEYSHHHARIEGFVEFFENQNTQPTVHHLNLKVDEKDSIHENLLANFLSEHQNIKAIYVPNSRAYSIASILKKSKNTDKMIIGFDTLDANIQYMKEGVIDILIGQQSKSQGYNAIVLMFNAIFRKEKIAKTNHIPIDILNKENIDYYEGLMR
ncbi:LacI family DNA-binding transcriptional regulator [Carboxylicivirga marina]|uniref:LacI family DNA-binding transcriptional regulator n=1 Tax=Carboxylicivirga marina TaxID=2800988 RepID=A0ABS1HF22_9BACT|nr:LacI family DNA-binding transcriptional regulator [Carboxylicivirga marina]MBK3516075.1 LacI family DNA-binding transcriptional regulator [Carboxylicivirga marina]